MQLLEELLVTVFQMRLCYFLLCLLGTLIKMLQKLALFQEILDTGQKYLAVEWLGDIGIGSMFITLGTMLLQILGGKHDDRDMRGCRVRLQLFGEL